MKGTTKTTVTIILFLALQLFVTGLTFRLPAEVVKTGDHSFYSTEEQMEYQVYNDVTKACQLGLLEITLEWARAENAEIYWVERVPDEVIEGMNKMGNCVLSKSSYKNVEVWNWLESNKKPWTIFIVYRR